jgi:predicted ATPase
VIEKVQFRNFKAYRSLELELEPFTVLVGPNASGKTTLLEGLSLLIEISGDMLQGGLPSRWAPPVQSYGSKAPVELGIIGRWAGVEGLVKAVSEPEPMPSDEAVPPRLPFKLSGSWNGKPYWAGAWDRNVAKGEVQGKTDLYGEVERRSLEQLRAGLSATSILRLEPGKLAEPSYSGEPVPYLHPDGEGLASILAYLKLSQDEVFNEIELTLKQVVPAVRRIRIERAPVERTAIRTIALDEQRHEVSEKRTLWGNRVVFDMRGAKGVVPTAAGEGTLMVLGLLTALLGPTRPRLVLLDDIELSLHPAAQARLIAALRAIQKRDPELQIVATSHSPFILNYLDPKEVRMTFLAENGFARCEKLTAHPEFEKWKGLMAPGEFWSNVGEEWIGKLGGAAANE